MELPKRKPLRLKGYDYSTPGKYFVTICTKHKRQILSHIVGAIHESPVNKLTPYGEIVKNTVECLPQRFNIEVEKYVIMPNHIHLIIVINADERAIRESPLHEAYSDVSKVIGFLKMNVSKKINSVYNEKEIWQRSYHDHIIRNEDDYKKIWDYIESNPLKWADDCYYN